MNTEHCIYTGLPFSVARLCSLKSVSAYHACVITTDFLPRDAMLGRYVVCTSVTSRYYAQTA